ncbi:MAG: methylenetetrahydrofolate reductase [Micropruina sp.]|uniref:methylenetetrahydrofolate reductase n=1 Tax=Micropruina sp. TaxID=2737536 RepID=UPI0039E39392
MSVNPAEAERPPAIAELLADTSRPTFSFEFFPPADEAGTDVLARTILDLDATGRPDWLSVTYGASGATRDRTIRATRFIKTRTEAQTVGHLTCASQSVDELLATLAGYAEAGVRHVLAIRGDMPGGPTVPWVRHPDGLANATELVALIAANFDFGIGVAAFPDAHPERRDPDLDARLLLAKQQAGASFAVTQLFFDAGAYFRMVERARAIGCTLPIVAGIQPVTNLAQINRFAGLSGAELPERVTSRLHAVGDDPAAVRAVGVEIATELSADLLRGGAPGLQFFTLNRSRATAAILANLRRLGLDRRTPAAGSDG